MMRSVVKWISRAVQMLLPVGLAAGVAIALVRSEEEPQRTDPHESARPLRVVRAESVPVAPRAVGYGVAEANRSWRSVARVAGRIVEVHPNLTSGGRVMGGDVLLRIDDTDAAISVASARSELLRLEAEAAQLTVEKLNDEASLLIEQRILEVAEGEEERMEGLVARDASSLADLESKQREVLTQRQTLRSIESAIALYPARRASLEAQLDGARASLAQSERDESFCVIEVPFAGVLGEVDLAVGQYVQAQEVLVELFDTSAMRVDAGVPEGEAFRLLDEEARSALRDAVRTGRVAEVVPNLLDAEVSAVSGGGRRSWTARPVGARESLDDQTRALRLSVLVEQDPAQPFGDSNPPLSQGTYCRVEFVGRPQSAIVVPRPALKEGALFVVDNNNRLRRREVAVRFSQGDVSVVASGVQAGDRIVLSDPTPAIDGLLVEPVEDETWTARLRQDVGGGR